MKKKSKNFFYFAKLMMFTIMSLCLIFACIVESKPTDAAEDAEPITALKADVTSQVTIDFIITNDWGTGFNGSVDVTNNGTAAIDGWELTWTFAGNPQIGNLWNGDLTQTGNAVSVKNVVHNKVIGPGQTVNFGFTANGTAEVPTDLVLNSGNTSSSSTTSSSSVSSSSSSSSSSVSSSSSTSSSVSSSSTSSSSSSTTGVDVVYTIDNDWGSGFVAKVVINNNTNKNITDWTITWTFPGNQTLTGRWNAVVTQSGKSVTAKPEPNTANIPAKGSVNFGFQCSYTGTNEIPADISITVSHSSASSSSSTSSSSSSSVSSAGPNADKMGIIYASWHPYHFENYNHYMNKIDEIKMKYVTVVPTYFIDTYAEGIRDNPANTPTLAQQKTVIKELLKRECWIVYRPHIDPYKYTLPKEQQPNHNTIPGGQDWRGKFDIDPLKTDYKDMMILNGLSMLNDAVAEIKLENPNITIRPMRYDIGAELMDSMVSYPEKWKQLLQIVKTTLSTDYPDLAPHLSIGHNFCHHLEYLTSIPAHTDYLKRINPQGVVNNEDLYVDRMTPAAKIAMGEYIAALDEFSISQYMPLDILASGTTTPEDVKNALIQHESLFFSEVLIGELGMTSSNIPPFHIGEYGMGILGLRAPNVWNPIDWTGRPEMLDYTTQRQHATTAIKGLIMYKKDPSSKAKSILIWLGGEPYDIFGMNPWSTGAYLPEAANAIIDYITEP